MACAYTTGVYPYGEKWDPVLLQGLLSNMVVCQIYGCDIQAYSIDTMQLCTNAIDARTIAACSITSTKISANSIIADHIQTDAITTTKIYAGSVDTTKIAACTIKACNIESGAVTAVKISVTDLGAICASTGCLTVSGYVQSTGYVSGPMGTGFCVNCDGIAEFQNICARGKFTTTVFDYSSVSAVAGSIMVPHDADVLDADMTALDASCLTTDGCSTFAAGDVLRIKVGNCEEWMCVASVVTSPTVYCVSRDLATCYTADENPIWTKGTAVINYGVSGDGGIFMTANEANAPHIDVYTHAGSPWSATTTRMRMGNLNGFLGYSTNLYGFAVGDANAYVKYDPTNGLRLQGKMCIQGADAGLYGYDANDCNIYKLTCDGFCMIDPADACNYSDLSAGALQFHDKLGAVPYVKRIKSGVANTGCVVDLCGWTVEPQVIVGIKSLCSYAVAQAAQNQRWDIYHDSMCSYTTSATCYGYCFVVHAALNLASGTGNECAKNIAFDACATTEACTCSTCTRFNFQYWCNGAAPDCYCYGTLCYAICYKTSTANPDVWEGACCYEYVQPHASVGEIKSTSNTYAVLNFPCMATWVIMPHQVSIAYTNSGVCSSSVTCALGSVAGNPTSSSLVATARGGGCTPNVYCTCTHTFTYDMTGKTWVSGCVTFTQNHCLMILDNSGTCCRGGYYCVQYGSCLSCFITSASACKEFVNTSNINCALGSCISSVSSYACATSKTVTSAHYTCARTAIGSLCQYICYSYATGDAASCADDCMCSITNTYGCYCTLDPAGILNWLAISYS